LTYATDVPEGSRIVAGTWWPPDYRGPPLLSFDAELAAGWGVHVGDTMTVNVLGREVTMTVGSLREAAWRSLGINFTLVASPGFFETAPHTHVATVRVAPAAEGAVLRAVTDALPNVTGIRVADVLGAIADMLGRIGTGLAAVGSVTLVAGALVLAGAIAVGQRRRVYEAVILKTLGGTRRQIRAIWLIEFGLLGLTAGCIAAVIGTAASFGVMRFIMDAPFVFLPGTLAATIVGCGALMTILGWIGTGSALATSAGPALRGP
jgi:putative ABC transport system permease protein